MYCAIDEVLLTKLKQLAASDTNNKDVVEALAAAEANPLLTGLFWTRNNMLVECRNLLKRRGLPGEFYEIEDVDDVEQPLSDPGREALAQEMASATDMFFPGARDEVYVELAREAKFRIRFRVECEAKRLRIPKRTIKRILSNEYAIDGAIETLTDEAIAGGLSATAKYILDELMREFSEHPERFPKATRGGEGYWYDNEFPADW